MDTIDKLFRAAGLASIPEGVVAPALVPLGYSTYSKYNQVIWLPCDGKYIPANVLAILT